MQLLRQESTADSLPEQIVEVTINGMFEIKVELEQDNQQLGEVVVVADEIGRAHV